MSPPSRPDRSLPRARARYRPDKVTSGWTVAIVSEGYAQAESDDGLFERDAAKVAVRLLNTPPFNHRDLRPLLVVVKVRIASVNTGNTIVPRFPVPAVSPFRTAFGAMFNRSLTSSHQPMERAIHGDNAAVKDLVHGQPGLASVQHFLVIVNNDRTYGGLMSEEVGWFTKARPTWPAVAVHELGHQAFGLDDEYPYDARRLTAYTSSPRLTSSSVSPNRSSASSGPQPKARPMYSQVIRLLRALRPASSAVEPAARSNRAAARAAAYGALSVRSQIRSTSAATSSSTSLGTTPSARSTCRSQSASGPVASPTASVAPSSPKSNRCTRSPRQPQLQPPRTAAARGPSAPL